MPALALTMVFGWLAFTIKCLMPVVSEIGPPPPGRVWADNAQNIEEHLVAWLTADGRVVVRGLTVGRFDEPEGWGLRTALQDFDAQMGDLGRRYVADTLIMDIAPSTPMGVVNAVMRDARAAGVKRFDLVVETWARD